MRCIQRSRGTRSLALCPAHGRILCRYKGTWQSLRLIAQEEGWRALWKGFAPKVARLGPGGGILLVGFDWFSGVARRHLM